MDKIIDLLTSLKKRIERLETNTGMSQFIPPKYSIAPTSPVEGEIYYDTSLNKARCWDGTSWNDLW